VTERIVPSGKPPEYASPDAAQARTWFEQGRYSDAAEVYRRLSLADGGDPLVGLAHVHCLVADGRYDYAAYVLRKTIEREADWNEIFMHVRGYYADWGVFVNHVAKLEQYTGEHPYNVSAKFLLGYSYLFWDRCEDAASLLREVVGQEPQDRGARYLLSLAEERANRPRQSS
jgi:thioredoxin-like negative regulator of GroEL